MAELYWPLLVDALLATWRADATLQAAKVLVSDGPLLKIPAGNPALLVGSTGTDDDGDGIGDSVLNWATANTNQRDAYEAVTCALWLLRGDPLSTVRSRVAELMTPVAASLRLKPFGLGVPGMFAAELATIRWVQTLTDVGPAVGAVFEVRAHARVPIS